MKKSAVLMFAVVFLGFAALVSAQTVQSGTWAITPATPGFSLDKSTGERTMTIDVDFNNPFDSKPNVVLSVTQIDADKDFNQRYNVEAISVSRDGFTLKIRTWADSKVYSLSGFWMAHAD
ncbi:MAG TPA: H-type lectin domain-containing protein [Ignavibacteriaceae bacterium]|nr:H-type lectin domain-containing protein [Ignavibacteriaceae bacterium]